LLLNAKRNLARRATGFECFQQPCSVGQVGRLCQIDSNEAARNGVKRPAERVGPLFRTIGQPGANMEARRRLVLQPVLGRVDGDVDRLRGIADTDQATTAAQYPESIRGRLTTNRIDNDVVSVTGDRG
jgi:hypothetical protein